MAKLGLPGSKLAGGATGRPASLPAWGLKEGQWGSRSNQGRCPPETEGHFSFLLFYAAATCFPKA